MLALEELRPGDIRMALSHAIRRGEGWRTALQRGVAMLRGVEPKAASILVEGMAKA